jgi:hypothetical protein
LGNLEGAILPGPLREDEKYIRIPFSDPEAIKILSPVAIWNLVKGTGLT